MLYIRASHFNARCYSMDLSDYIRGRPDRVKMLASNLRLAGKARSLIYDWAAGRRRVPFDRCVQLEQASAGQLRCEALRPDLAPLFTYLRDSLCPPCGSTGEDRTGVDA